MAKDGTRRGGARPGAGRKPKALTEKINEGRRAEVMLEPAELVGADIPPVKDFLKAPQKNGQPLIAEEVYNDTYKWLKARGCEKLVSQHLVEQYAMSVSRWVQCENIVSQTGMLLMHRLHRLRLPSRSLVFFLRLSSQKITRFFADMVVFMVQRSSDCRKSRALWKVI